MKLDSRIKNGKTYLDCFHTETAKKFIGKECYIAERIIKNDIKRNIHIYL